MIHKMGVCPVKEIPLSLHEYLNAGLPRDSKIRPSGIIAEMITDAGTQYVIRDDYMIFRLDRSRNSGDLAWMINYNPLTRVQRPATFDDAVKWINDHERELLEDNDDVPFDY